MCQADAREIGRQGTQVGLHPGGTGVHDEVIGQPIEIRAKGAADIEVVHQAPRTRGKQHIAAVDIGGIHPAQVDGRTSDGAECILRAIFAVQATNLHGPFPTSRGHLKAIAHAQGARGKRSGNHGARALHAKGAVHPQAHGCLRIGSGHSGKDLIERLPQRRNAVAGRGGYGDNGGVGKRGAGQLRSDFCGAVHSGAVAAS